ncbi:suppressor of tub2 mutation [Lambiella insularis]|nr:suppressor of tub2 mutation [Lambiella insularis]
MPVPSVVRSAVLLPIRANLKLASFNLRVAKSAILFPVRVNLKLAGYNIKFARYTIDHLLSAAGKLCHTTNGGGQEVIEDQGCLSDDIADAGVVLKKNIEDISLFKEHIALFEHLKMEQQAIHLLTVLKNPSVSVESKAELLTKLKTHIKHHQVPELAICTTYEVARTAISNAQLLELGFSILFHLTKRLEIQDQSHIVACEAKKTYPYLLERLGDSKDRTRAWALQAFTEFWKASHTDVEQFMRDVVLGGKSSKAKEAALQWVVKTKELSFQIKPFVPHILDCLEDSEGTVRDTAKSTVIELFRPLPDGAKSDLKKQISLRNIQKSIVAHIYSQLEMAAPPEVAITPVNALESEAPAKDKALGEIEADKLDPIYVYSNRELEEVFREMHPHFEGREQELNWTRREKSIIKLRKLTKGNAPTDYITTYLASIKALLDGILKAVNSLRTTLSGQGCQLIQDIARTSGSGMDSMVEILLQALIKMCGGTKTVAVEHANTTVDAILANVTYNVRLVQHIWTACQDKNVRPRSFATGWLKTILDKHAHHKGVIEHANGLELIEKCVKQGLADPNPAVKESMRATYWAYWRSWPDRAEIILASLDAKQQARLLKDASNPDPNKISADSTTTTATKVPILVRSTTNVPTRPSLKEAIAAQKKAKLAERPGSAQESVSPTRAMPPRPQTSMATGSLSSAPLRPLKAKLAPKKDASPATSPKKTKTKAPLPDFNAMSKAATKPTLSHRKSATGISDENRKRASLKGLSHKQENTKPVTTEVNTVDSPPGPMSLLKILGSNGVESDPNKQASAPILSKAAEEMTTLLTTRTNTDDSPSGSMSLSKILDLDSVESGTNEQASTPYLSKAAEEMTMLLPIRTTTVESPGGPMSLSKTLDPNGVETGRSILGELPLNHEGVIRPVANLERATVVANMSGFRVAQSACSFGSTTSTVVRGRMHSPVSTVSRNSSTAGTEQKLIDSGIARIRTVSLDAHGYRKLQSLISTRPDLWQDGRYAELFQALLGNLETIKATNIAATVLKTLRMMITSHPALAQASLTHAIRTFLLVRGYYRDHTYLADDLEDLVRDVIAIIEDSHAVARSIVSLLENYNMSLPATVTLALEALTDIIYRGVSFDDTDKKALGSALQGLIAHKIIDVRQHAMKCLLAFHSMATSEADFWSCVGNLEADDKNLLAYFLAVRAGAS